MKQYIVLYPISPDQGEQILPAPEGEPPTIVGEDVLFATPSELLTNEERAKLLIDKGIIVPADQPGKVDEARLRLPAVEAEAAASLRQITTNKDV
jgi:hypothetical protein